MLTNPPIDYDIFLRNASQADIDAIVALAGGQVVATNVEADFAGYQAMGDRLWGAGLLRRLRVGKEDRNGEVWFTIDGIVHGVAINHIAKAARDHAAEAQTPPPPPAP